MAGMNTVKMTAIANAVGKGNYRYTLHAAQKRIARGLTREEIETVLQTGEIIEDYPNHHYGPACLIFGKTGEGKPIHILCSQGQIVVIITVYEPNPQEWEDFKRRKTL